MTLDDRQITKILERSAELVERGWCQNHLGRMSGGFQRVRLEDLTQADEVCLVGAVTLATHEITGLPLSEPPGADLLPAALDDARSQALCRVSVPMNMPSFDLSGWNDAHGRTADQVAAALRHAAHREAAHA